MNEIPDIRVSTGLPAHRKTKRLKRLLGFEGCWMHVCVLLWARVERPDGNLAGLTAEDIELAVDWAGAPGALVAALVEVGFLDGGEGTYALHDWDDHNPWSTGSRQRSLKAKWNAVKRHHGAAEADRAVPEFRRSNATSTQPDAAQHDVAPKDDAPSPSPSPSPEELASLAPAREEPLLPLPIPDDHPDWRAWVGHRQARRAWSIQAHRAALGDLRQVGAAGGDLPALLRFALKRNLGDLLDAFDRMKADAARDAANDKLPGESLADASVRRSVDRLTRNEDSRTGATSLVDLITAPRLALAGTTR